MLAQAVHPGLQPSPLHHQHLQHAHAALISLSTQQHTQACLHSSSRHKRWHRLPAAASTHAIAAAARAEASEVDVVVVGSGIIGLLVTRQLLLQQEQPLSVALFDQQQPCAGATGAGQGYLWLAHRDPTSPTWPLARHSKALWHQLAAESSSSSNNNKSSSLGSSLEYQATGSLLLATTDAEVQQLQQRADMLTAQGVDGVQLLSPRELAMAEPALRLPPGSRGLLVKSDAQINGKRAAFALLDECQRLAGAAAANGSSNSDNGSNNSSSSNRRQLLVGLQEGVQQLTPLEGGGGVEVVTSSRRVRARCGVVVAAGVWSGPLLAAATGDAAWARLLQPRRGHLLELQPPPGMSPIHTGMMELAYTQHYSSTPSSSTPTPLASAAAAAAAAPDAAGSSSSSGPSHSPVDITFTATTSASGSLLLGSSREFSGWESVPSSSIIAAILQRASLFLPDLAAVQPSDVLGSTRVGLRPYAVGGLPAIGPVPGLPQVVVAAGHEGSGLCLGPATAELVLQYLVLGGGDSNKAGGRGQQAFGQQGEESQASLQQAAQELLPEQRLAQLGVQV